VNQPESLANTTACDLAGEVVRTFGEVRLRVVGTSMVPSILPGDLISVERAGATEISSGDVVVYSREGRLIAHRVVGATSGAEQPLLITRGDRLENNDSPVTSAEVIGRVASIQCADRCCNRQVESPIEPVGFKYLLRRAVRASNRATYFYVRLASCWSALFCRGSKCQA
jgi:signal peptidase I